MISFFKNGEVKARRTPQVCIPNRIKATVSGTKHRLFKRPKDLENLKASIGRVLGKIFLDFPRNSEVAHEEWS